MVLPTSTRKSASDWASARASVSTTMNSRPCTWARIMALTVSSAVLSDAVIVAGNYTFVQPEATGLKALPRAMVLPFNFDADG